MNFGKVNIGTALRMAFWKTILGKVIESTDLYNSLGSNEGCEARSNAEDRITDRLEYKYGDGSALLQGFFYPLYYS